MPFQGIVLVGRQGGPIRGRNVGEGSFHRREMHRVATPKGASCSVAMVGRGQGVPTTTRWVFRPGLARRTHQRAGGPFRSKFEYAPREKRRAPAESPSPIGRWSRCGRSRASKTSTGEGMKSMRSRTDVHDCDPQRRVVFGSRRCGGTRSPAGTEGARFVRPTAKRVQ